MVLLVNNLGGSPLIELLIMARRAKMYLEMKKVCRFRIRFTGVMLRYLVESQGGKSSCWKLYDRSRYDGLLHDTFESRRCI